MSLAPTMAIGMTGLALFAGATALWAKFGSLVFFDLVSAGFTGCFF